jgi:transcriptional regulator with GAF, ATPase, and Fis domain
LKAELFKIPGPDEIVCVSESMKKVISLASKVAGSDSAVLITGESGTGKELIARFIHHQSTRKSKRFVPINCAAISPNLVESEMFGHEKGAFTGADRRTQGKFEFADKGTLFLDEIGDLSLEAQATLLRVLQEKKIQRVGGNEEMDVDVRLVCATNRNLEDLVEKKQFREDLFYRINVFPIEATPLRERKMDIVPLCTHFLKRFSGKEEIQMTDGAIRLATEYRWPGNVRELVNVMERALILGGDHGGITAEVLSFLRKAPACDDRNGIGFRLPADGISFEVFQQDIVRQAMAATGDNQTLAAELLGLTRAKFRVLLKNSMTD